MTDHHAGRPPHPQYGAPLSGAPRIYGGVTFRPYRTGISRYCIVSDDFRIQVGHTGEYKVFYALIDGKASLGKRFRFERTAALAAIKKACKRSSAP